MHYRYKSKFLDLAFFYIQEIRHKCTPRYLTESKHPHFSIVSNRGGMLNLNRFFVGSDILWYELPENYNLILFVIGQNV